MKYARKLSRRTFLRGAGGIAIAVPFLDEMRSRSVWAAPAAPPVRAFNIFFGGGAPQIFQKDGLVGPLAPLCAPLAEQDGLPARHRGPGRPPGGKRERRSPARTSSTTRPPAAPPSTTR